MHVISPFLSKEGFEKRLVKGTKFFLKKKKKGANMLVRDIENFQKKKMKGSVKEDAQTKVS